ncbi:pilus assembly protein N-terminal domain-containing protein [Methylobacterium nodulans]|uniref:Pilus formation protein N-terminal domain-containing protein n=1 Tax=Methylobacterium nodulans (strain LMG 21967 / CNCM I-2342 / ORS 2060) TaxID=460265 RepID=B8IRE7_METNO|nr:pilus assembly protein N-terminal domain-containing protein [Methylobacterium nodulans]ACL58687.1 hypothetical protein Mnod_3781 [Methylobacterium nodulans ORS 2060]
MKRFRPTLHGVAAVALASLLPAMSQAADTLDLTVGHSQILRPGKAVGTIAIGDPDIADATTAAGGTILVTGKKIGTTNIIALDETGSEVLASTLRVVPIDRRPKYSVDVIKGGQRIEYSCGPELHCAPTKDVAKGASATVVVEPPLGRPPAGAAATTVSTQTENKSSSE